LRLVINLVQMQPIVHPELDELLFPHLREKAVTGLALHPLHAVGHVVRLIRVDQTTGVPLVHVLLLG